MKLLDSQFDLKIWNLVSKCNLSCFWPPEKSVFELVTNVKFSFSPKTNIFIWVFELLWVPWMTYAPNHILSSNSARKILKIAIKSEQLGLCKYNLWNFQFSMRLSNGYFMDFTIFDLTWIWWISQEWPHNL